MRFAATVAVGAILLAAGAPLSSAEIVQEQAASEQVRIPAMFESVAVRSAPALERQHVRSRVVKLDGGALEAMLGGARSSTVALNLFDDTNLEATTDLLEAMPDGDLNWRGRLGDRFAYATITRRGGEVAGIVRAVEGTFEIVPMGDGLSRVTQVHVDALPGCGVDGLNLPGNPLDGNGLMAAIERTVVAEEEAEGQAGTDAQNATARGESNPTLDQLVAYTPRALSWVGGTTSGMNAFIDNAILDMNTVFANSGIDLETRVVYKHPLTEDETGSGVGDRDDFRIDGDGKWDEIHDLRDDFGADIGHILVRDSNVCGIAAQIYRGSSTADRFAFCLTAMGCVSNLTFVHEVGHVIGCAHDFANSGGFSGTFSYSFGWFDPDTTPRWHTIMSYSPGGASSRIPYFSTPEVTWNDGNAIGDAQLADNSRTINLNIPDITSWRGSVGLAPTDIQVIPAASEIALSWDPVSQATGYEIWRGATTDPGQSSLRGFRTETSYTDSSVVAEQTYYYFLRSQFADGGRSPFTDPIEATTSSQLTADLSGDGVVNAVDLASLIAAWGTPGADISGDGTTNAVDLASLIAAWGG